MTTERLKVILVTMDEPYYIPKYINDILRKLGKDTEAIKVYALPPNLSKKSFIKTVRSFLSYFGPILFSYMVILRMYYLVTDFLNERLAINDRFHSVKLVCRKFEIPFANNVDINSDEVITEIENLKPDVVFSVAAPQIFREKLMSIPSKGCLNIHSSLLPKYRGLNANFWVLAKGEKKTGITIHYINPGIDDGDILLQKELDIESGWSLNNLYHKVMEVGSDAIAECLGLVHKDNIHPRKNDISNSSYFTFPTREDVKEFRKLKKRFFKYY